MNLRPKAHRPELNTIRGRIPFLAIVVFSVSVSVNVNAASRASNQINFPITLSLPASSEMIEKSIIRFGNGRFREGFEVSQVLTDVKISDPFEMKLAGVKFNGLMKGRLDRDAKGLIVEASVENLQVSIEAISIHTVVRTRLSGVDASVRIDAECRDSKITWPNRSVSFFARGRIATVPSLKLDMSGLALSADLDRPQMILSCQGPFGIDDAIRDYAWSAIQARWTDRLFAEEIEAKIEETFASSLAIGGSGFNLVNQSRFNATLFTESYISRYDSSHLRARVELRLNRPVALREFSASEAALPIGEIDEVTVSIPTAVVESIANAWFTPGIWSEWIDGQNVNGFRELMSSRFKQIIAFPDLQNYPKDAPFWFVMDMNQNLAMKCSDRALNVAVSTGAWMLLKDPGFAIGFKPLVHFSIPTELSIFLPQVKSRKVMQAAINSMDLSYEFDARYVRTERPNTIIAGDQILDGIKEFAESKMTDLTSIEGLIGETAKALNQTSVSCEPSQQLVRIALPASL